jgi:D-alanine transaminase
LNITFPLLYLAGIFSLPAEDRSNKRVVIETVVYLSGIFSEVQSASVSPLDRGFNFADGVYEVIRSYCGSLFELESHLDRLRRSLREVRIDVASADGLGDIFRELLERNGLEGVEALVYVQITRGAAPRQHQFPGSGTVPTVYAHAVPFDPLSIEREKGIPVILVPDSRWSRCDIKSTALLPNILARQMAEDNGASEAIFVRSGVITEGTSSTFCAVLSGAVVTHPESNFILPGITKRVVLDICARIGIPVSERPIREEEISRAAEMMVLSTTREVMPVVSVDGIDVGGGVPGQLTRKIQASFTEILRSL